MGNIRKIFKEIRMSKNKMLFLRDGVKDFKKILITTLQTIWRVGEQPQEWISGDLLYDLWAS